MKKDWLLYSLVFFLLSFSVDSSGVKDQISNTGLLVDSEDQTLLVSTLDGALHAVNKNSGSRKWTLNEDAIIRNPSDSVKPGMPRFFPNPQDGSLYRYTLGRGKEPLKKLPFTIPELVSNSPCRSSDGIFYLGKKMDSWLGIDSVTGKKQIILSMDTVEKMCPKPSSHTIYLGRTLYNIILFDPLSANKWNVSFYHYTTTNGSQPIKDYDLVHYTATGEGTILTVDQQSGSILWNLDLHSPVVAMYLLGTDGTLATVPLTAVAPQTLEHFTYDLAHHAHFDIPPGSEAVLVKKLSPTIYLGQSENGIYAMPALVDEETITISRKESQLLLEGPPGSQATMHTGPQKEPDPAVENSDLIVLGYYDLPESLKSELNKLSPKEIEGLGFSEIPVGISYNNNGSSVNIHIASVSDTEEIEAHYYNGFQKFIDGNLTFVLSHEFINWGWSLLYRSITWPFLQPINLIAVILVIILSAFTFFLYKLIQDYARLNERVSSQLGSQGSNRAGSGGNVTAEAHELDTGEIQVGKIIFNPKAKIGKGCDGTFVFKGTFDGRSVAVKRVLPGCFSIADREVELLRESDEHPHVIRYFCMEQCREFRYIALELCAGTLENFVSSDFQTDVSPTAFLYQATSGLNHLHSLGIVHRDIKPSNVLLSFPNSNGEVRALISDFGLCRRLEIGHTSFSKKSGITGTEGWIAPEMMNSARATTKVDVFSLGCVFYYVLSKGKHPFGALLERQSRILNETSCLDGMDKEKDVLCWFLIEKMIAFKDVERPPTPSVLKYPLFWSNDLVLQFFQDVSDRLELESSDSLLLMNLEWGATKVVRGDWQAHMHPCIAEDLRKFRDYKSRSVRDLLRAFRNKKNHYRELSLEAQQTFGPLPNGFVPYWTRRFPSLLIHTWLVMQTCKTEAVFKKYYFHAYNFKHTLNRENDQHFVFSPNNQPVQSTINCCPKQETIDPLDAILGPPKKGLRKHPKQEDSRASNAIWMTKRPINTFEPKFETLTVKNPDALTPLLGDQNRTTILRNEGKVANLEEPKVPEENERVQPLHAEASPPLRDFDPMQAEDNIKDTVTKRKTPKKKKKPLSKV